MKPKKVCTEPFDRRREPPRQNLFLTPLMWAACWLLTRSGRLKINKVRMKGAKPPFLVLGTHHAFMDFYVTPLALFPYRANYVSELEGFESYGEWIYRQAGALGTRKFVSDPALVQNIRRVIARGDSLVLYPEARYANVGTSSVLPTSVGKLAKLLGVPVVTINMRGNYLQSPIWNLTRRKGVPLEADVTQLFTREELADASLEQVQEAIQAALAYDEYRWQAERKICISYEKRADGLEAVLYQCPRCRREFEMRTRGAEIFCGGCGASWHMNEWGQLEPEDTAAAVHIPDWYEWQREEVHRALLAGAYHLEMRVRIESLPNAKNFIDLGEGVLQHNGAGFSLTFTDYGQTREQVLHIPPVTMPSVHTEYDYRGKGQCITLSTADNTYFIYPLEAGFNATKIQFATEGLYHMAKGIPIHQ